MCYFDVMCVVGHLFVLFSCYGHLCVLFSCCVFCRPFVCVILMLCVL